MATVDPRTPWQDITTEHSPDRSFIHGLGSSAWAHDFTQHGRVWVGLVPDLSTAEWNDHDRIKRATTGYRVDFSMVRANSGRTVIRVLVFSENRRARGCRRHRCLPDTGAAQGRDGL